MNILEARQKDNNTISKGNGDYETILQGDAIVLEQGDTLEMSEAFIDTTETAAQSIFLKEDIEVKISYVMYKVLSDTTIPKDGVEIFGGGDKMIYKFWGCDRDAAAGNTAFYKQPLSTPDGPAIMGQYIAGGLIDDTLSEITGIRFKYINTMFRIPEFTMLIEFTDCRGVVSSLPIHIPEQPPVGNKESEILTLNFIDLKMGNGFRVNNLGSFGSAGGGGKFKVLNPEILQQSNFSYVDTLFTNIPNSQKHFVPVRRRFTFNLNAGKYAPADIAQIITRETQQIRNSTTNRTYITNDPSNITTDLRYLLTPFTPQSGQNYRPEENANPNEFHDLNAVVSDSNLIKSGAYLGPHFYTNTLFYPPMDYHAGDPANPSAEELQGLVNRYGFYYDATDFDNSNSALIKKQLMVSQSILSASPPPNTDAAPVANFARQVYFGSSQGVVMSFDDRTNRFQIDNLHSPYFLQSSLNIGKVGWKSCAEVVPNENSNKYVRGQPSQDNIGIQGSLGGVMLTGLEPYNFWEETLGFSIHDVCVPLSFRSSPTEWKKGFIASGYSSSALNDQGLSELVVNGSDALNTAPRMFYLVNDNKDFNPPYPIGGLSTIRNVYQGRKLTSCFVDKSSSIQFNIEADPTNQFDDPNYEFNINPGVCSWDGSYVGADGADPNNVGRPYLMRVAHKNGADPATITYFPGTEQEQTATTYIRAKNFAQGTTLSSAYFLVEVAGLFQNTFIGGSSYNKMICGILNRYYSTGQYTSGSTPFSYTHLGKEPLHLRSIRVRILTPDGNLATGIGDDNSVILTHRKAPKTIMLDNLNILDENSSKKDIKDREKLLKELSK